MFIPWKLKLFNQTELPPLDFSAMKLSHKFVCYIFFYTRKGDLLEPKVKISENPPTLLNEGSSGI